MLPILCFCKDRKEHRTSEIVDSIAKEFSLSDDELNDRYSSGQKILYNRIGWAVNYLKKALLIESKGRGVIKILERGLDALGQNPAKINLPFLKKYPEFSLLLKGIADDKKSATVEKNDNAEFEETTPEEMIEDGYKKIRNALSDELLDKVKVCSPSFFEMLVVDLLVKMGYGGSNKEAGRAVGRTGDDGIDGIIKEDHLGLDVIYIQAKRWDKVSVSVSEVRSFAGAMLQKGAKKGVFITTSKFTSDALSYIEKLGDTKLILIDGEKLTELMMNFNVGVKLSSSYELKKIDSDYFSED